MLIDIDVDKQATRLLCFLPHATRARASAGRSWLIRQPPSDPATRAAPIARITASTMAPAVTGAPKGDGDGMGGVRVGERLHGAADGGVEDAAARAEAAAESAMADVGDLR